MSRTSLYENDGNESVGRKNEEKEKNHPQPELSESTQHSQTQLAREQSEMEKKHIQNECTA